MMNIFFQTLIGFPFRLLLLGLLLTGCSTYGDRVAPVPLPALSVGRVDVKGAQVVATSYLEEKNAKAVFGFDIRGAGLLPVRLVIDNQSGKMVSLQPQQTFLIDNIGQAWPLLSSDQAYRRVSSDVEIGETLKGVVKPSVLMGAAGAVAGFAIGVISGQNLADTTAKGAIVGASAGGLYGGAKAHEAYGQQIRNDLVRQSLRNKQVLNSELAYGYLFFPGRDEAQSAKALRLGVLIGDELQVITIPLFER
jgi:hypothetical protein